MGSPPPRLLPLPLGVARSCLGIYLASDPQQVSQQLNPPESDNMSCKSFTVQDAITMLVVKFEEYAKKRDGDANTLNSDELYDFAIAELPDICGSGKKDEVLKGIIGKMDANNDKKVTFEEFMCFLACLTIALRECFKK